MQDLPDTIDLVKKPFTRNDLTRVYPVYIPLTYVKIVPMYDR
jgi:hypothetical protein